MACHPLIEQYAAELGRELPAAAVEELSDGLIETYERMRTNGAGPDDAAVATIAEFGGVDEVVAAFIRESPGRRVAVGLLATGPIVGTCWALAFLIGRAWTWPLPSFVPVVLGCALCATVAALLVAAMGRIRYRCMRLAAAACTSVIVIDLAVITAALAVAPVLVWPMAIAIPASILRIGFTASRLRSVLAPHAV